MLNGVSQGTVTELTGLKTGDKVEITTVKKEEPAADDNAKIIEGVGNTSIILRSQLTKNGNVLLTWTKSKGYKVDYVQNFTDVDDKIINKANKEIQRLRHEGILRDGRRKLVEVPEHQGTEGRQDLLLQGSRRSRNRRTEVLYTVVQQSLENH